MSIKPILFSGPMVRAILDGKKTQTRRVLNPQPAGPVIKAPGGQYAADLTGRCFSLPYAPDDLLWVRESHYLTDDGDDEYAVYAADGNEAIGEHLHQVAALESGHPSTDWSRHKKRRPSIHMPRWASRLTLEVTGVRVQRVQEISEEDADAEGVDAVSMADVPRQAAWSRRQDFSRLWDSLNAKRGFGWEENPWVVAITFKAHRCNVDILEKAE